MILRGFKQSIYFIKILQYLIWKILISQDAFDEVSYLKIDCLIDRLYNTLNMIQELKESRVLEEYGFIKGDFASVKIKMEPKSLLLQVPLDWEINKIKCLLVKIIPRLEFDMFALRHDGQDLQGKATLQSIIANDNQQNCLRGDHYVLTFGKLNCSKQQFERYYGSKMRSLVGSLEKSPFQPVLHPGYYATKSASSLASELARQLITNINQLQQIQQVIQQQRRQAENQQGFFAIGGMGGNDGGQQGWINRFGTYVIRIIQILSILTILRFIVYNSNMEIFIILGGIILLYFAIDFFKKRNRDNKDNQYAEPAPKLDTQQLTKASFIQKVYLPILIFMVEKIFLFAQCLGAYILSLFPNWTVNAHRAWLFETYSSVQLKLNEWKYKISPIEAEISKSQQTQPQPEKEIRELKEQSSEMNVKQHIE